MKCQFCQQECTEKIIHQTSLGKGASEFTCKHKNDIESTIIYTKFHKDEKLHKYVIYCGSYIASFYMPTNRFDLYQAIEDHNGVYQWKFILDLPFLPDITPTNFAARIKAMIILL